MQGDNRAKSAFVINMLRADRWLETLVSGEPGCHCFELLARPDESRQTSG